MVSGAFAARGVAKTSGGREHLLGRFIRQFSKIPLFVSQGDSRPCFGQNLLRYCGKTRSNSSRL